MTDLILRYGNNPSFLLNSHEVNLFPTAGLPSYFSINNQGNFEIAQGFFNNPLQDVYRYDLIFDSGNGILVHPNTNTPARGLNYQAHCQHHGQDKPIDSANNKIVIVLESPHKSEYCNHCFSPIAPANGITGRKIFSRFIATALPLISNLFTLDRYSICIVNPVPFQTSLQFIHKNPNMPVRLRNNVWKKLYIAGCEADFKSRIASYSPRMIINACTHDLKPSVTTTLSHFNNIPTISMKHPTKW